MQLFLDLVGKSSQAPFVDLHKGTATVFNTQREIYRQAPRLTRSRLYLEKLDEVLPNLTKYIDLTAPDGPGPELWLRLDEGLEPFPLLDLPTPPLEEGSE